MRAKEEERKAKEENGDASKGGPRGKSCLCEELGHKASESIKKTAYLRGKGKNNIHQVEEDDQERHDQTWGHSTYAPGKMSRRARMTQARA